MKELELDEIARLRGDLQDMYHYAALISGVAESTFEGSREYGYLGGYCQAYESLVDRVHCWERNDVPALRPFTSLNLLDGRSIKRQAVMKKEARRAFKAVLAVARSYETDANSGERIK